MITRHVWLAFERLAAAQGAAALLEMAENASENPTQAETDAFLYKLTEVDPDIRQLHDTARSDDFLADAAGEGIGGKMDVLRKTIESALVMLAKGVPGKVADAVSSGDVGKLVGVLKYLLEKGSRGEDRGIMSIGLRERMSEIHIQSLAGEEVGQAVNDLLESQFAGEIPSFVEAYKSSRPPGSDKKRWQLLREKLGGEAQAAAEAHVLEMVYKSLRTMIDNKNYADKNDDMHAFNSIMYPVRKAIESGITGDDFDPQQEESGTIEARRNWAKYVSQLIGLPQFGGRGLDRRSVLEWINENFFKPELAGNLITAPRFQGDSDPVTAPARPNRLMRKTLDGWFQAVTPVRSLDEAGSGQGGSLGEKVETRDVPLEQREEYQVLYLGETDNRQRIREKVKQYIKRATQELPSTKREKSFRTVRGLDTASEKARSMYEHILLVKLGFGSDTDRKGFEEAWATNEEFPHRPFRTEMNEDEWRSLERPLRRGYKNDPDQAPHSGYIKEWTQTVLVNQRTGLEIKSITEFRDNPDNVDWKLVKKVHKVGEEPDRQHFLNWVEYTEGDRLDDIRQTLDAYDGQAWFERSLTEDAQKALKAEVNKGEAIGHIDPTRVFKGWSKNVDTPMLRAVGWTKQSVDVQYNSISPLASSLVWDMSLIMSKFTTLVDDDVERGVKDAEWVWVYLYLKGKGRIASARLFGKEATDRIVRSVVAALI